MENIENKAQQEFLKLKGALEMKYADKTADEISDLYNKMEDEISAWSTPVTKEIEAQLKFIRSSVISRVELPIKYCGAVCEFVDETISGTYYKLKKDHLKFIQMLLLSFTFKGRSEAGKLRDTLKTLESANMEISKMELELSVLAVLSQEFDDKERNAKLTEGLVESKPAVPVMEVVADDACSKEEEEAPEAVTPKKKTSKK